MELSNAQEKLNKLSDNIGKVIVGKEDVVKKVLICFIAGGHVLSNISKQLLF
ncbi:MAG: hypothetical protein IKN34_00070 [Treponema sp.]|nr:hypothetical protein [Treponema sp.]